MKLLATLLLVLLAGPLLAAPEDYRPGDVIFLRIPTSFGRAIEDVTHTPVSHVGLIAQHESGHLTVVHALMKVQEEPLERFLERGRGHFAVSRYAFRSEADRDQVIAAARHLLGLPYDYEFVMTNQAIYCSELIYRAFADGLHETPVALRPLTFGAPGTESRKVFERIVHGAIPEGAAGVAPGDYYRSPAFRVIEDHLEN